MSDETVAAGEETKKAARTRSPFNTQALNELALAQALSLAAQRPECASALAERGIAAGWVTTLLTDAQSCQKKLGIVVSLHGQKTGSTGSESALKTTLLNRLTDAQTSATQAWSGKPEHRGDLDAYGIGQPLRSYARPALETLVEGILARIENDKLPGLSEAKIAALRAAFAGWKSADASQTTHGADAALLLGEAKRELRSIKSRRIDLQIAADGAFPYYDKDNAPTRAEFRLPKTRPYRPVRE